MLRDVQLKATHGDGEPRVRAVTETPKGFVAMFDATAAEVEDFARRMLDVAARAKRQRQPKRQA